MFEVITTNMTNHHPESKGTRGIWYGVKSNYELERFPTGELILWIGDINSVGGEDVTCVRVQDRDHARKIVRIIEGIEGS